MPCAPPARSHLERHKVFFREGRRWELGLVIVQSMPHPGNVVLSLLSASDFLVRMRTSPLKVISNGPTEYSQSNLPSNAATYARWRDDYRKAGGGCLTSFSLPYGTRTGEFRLEGRPIEIKGAGRG